MDGPETGDRGVNEELRWVVIHTTSGEKRRLVRAVVRAEQIEEELPAFMIAQTTQAVIKGLRYGADLLVVDVTHTPPAPDEIIVPSQNRGILALHGPVTERRRALLREAGVEIAERTDHQLYLLRPATLECLQRAAALPFVSFILAPLSEWKSNEHRDALYLTG